MKRLFLLSPLVLATAIGAATADEAPPVQVLRKQIQIQPGFPVEPGYPGQPGSQPKPREDFKPDSNTNPDPKSLEVSADTLKKAEQLVRLMGSTSYRDRESATREIQAMGRLAIKPLMAARSNETNPELRIRVDMVLPAAEADDMKARVACFLADSEAKYDHVLPGWNKFKDVVGNDKLSRELFAEVLKKRDMHTLLLASDLPANELSQVLTSHYREMMMRQNGAFRGRGDYMPGQPPSTPELIVLAFLESCYTDQELSLNYLYGNNITQWFYQPDFQNAMSGRGNSKYALQIRKVMTRWLDTRVTSQGAQMAMQFAQNWGMNNDIPKYAARVLEGEVVQGNFWVKTNALTVLGQRSDAKKYVSSMMKVFDDNSIIQQPWPGAPANITTITLGDFALGVAISVTGQDHKNYDMQVMNNGYKWNQNNYYFKDEDKNKAEDKRKAAIKKFKDWYAKEQEGKKDEPKKDEPKKDEPKKDEPKKDELKQVAPPPPPGLPVPLPAIER